MADKLIVDGNRIEPAAGKVLFNGQELNAVHFNDAEVWAPEASEPVTELFYATGYSTWNISGSGTWSNMARAWDKDLETYASTTVTNTTSPGIRFAYNMSTLGLTPGKVVLSGRAWAKVYTVNNTAVKLRWNQISNSSTVQATTTNITTEPNGEATVFFDLTDAHLTTINNAITIGPPYNTIYLPIGFARVAITNINCRIYESWLELTYQ